MEFTVAITDSTKDSSDHIFAFIERLQKRQNFKEQKTRAGKNTTQPRLTQTCVAILYIIEERILKHDQTNK